MKKFSIAMLIIFLLIGCAVIWKEEIETEKKLPGGGGGIASDQTEQKATETDTGMEAVQVVKEPTQVRLMMIGDMLMHLNVIDSGKQEDGKYNFDHVYEHIKDRIDEADLAMVNQETIFGGDDRGFTGYPAFNSPTAVGDAEVKAGFDVILQATNHTLDKGSKGVLNDINFWRTNYPDIACLGIHDSKADQDDNVYIYEKDDIKIAILNYTYGTNGISTSPDMPYLVDYFDEDKVTADIDRAEELADFTIVCPHWGTEYNTGTDAYQKKWTQIFLEHGVDLVIGTHPHVIEPIEWVTDENGHKMLVYYSLGNFISAQNEAPRMVGGLAKVTISRDESGKVAILDHDIEAVVCHIAEGKEYTVYPLGEYTKELAEKNKIRETAKAFSLQFCKKLVKDVWGEEYRE